jgi:hypothetical protein
MIPKLSAPLTKDIRTGEGILEWVLAAIGVVAGATGDLSVSKTGLYLTILAVSKSVRRLLLKVVAAQKGAGIGAPLQPAILGQIGAFEPAAVTAATDVLSEISAAEVSAAAVQAKPGVPAETLAAALSPSPPPAVPPPAS